MIITQPRPCYTIQCDQCKDFMHSEGQGPLEDRGEVHLTSMEDAKDMIDGCQWKMDGSKVYCDYCWPLLDDEDE